MLFSSPLCLAALLFLSSLDVSAGYASWLKCFVELDPTEVIMWQRIIPASNAEHDVRIEVQPFGFGNNEWLQGDGDENLELTLPAPHPGAPLTLRVRLQVPEALQREEVQFVIEAKTSAADSAAEAVEFIDRGVMCDGSRAFSRRHDEHVILQLDLAAHPNLEYVQLTAAWAPGMEAVTLTPTLTLKPSTASSSDEL